jgi:hypothetical protein
MKSFRPVLKPDPSGGVTLSVEPSGAAKGGLGLLEETMGSYFGLSKKTFKLNLSPIPLLIIKIAIMQIEIMGIVTL